MNVGEILERQDLWTGNIHIHTTILCRSVFVSQHLQFLSFYHSSTEHQRSNQPTTLAFIALTMLVGLVNGI